MASSGRSCTPVARGPLGLFPYHLPTPPTRRQPQPRRARSRAAGGVGCIGGGSQGGNGFQPALGGGGEGGGDLAVVLALFGRGTGGWAAGLAGLFLPMLPVFIVASVPCFVL